MLSKKITNLSLYAAVFLLPLFFLPWTLEPLEINKQTLLTLLIIIACLSSAITIFIKGEILVKKSLIKILLILFLTFTAVSATLSQSHFLSWVGTSQQEYTSFFSLLVLAILFSSISGAAKKSEVFSKIILSLISGAVVAGIFGLLSIFKIYLPFSFAQSQTFNTVGTLNSLGVFLSVATIAANGFFLIGLKKNQLIKILTILLSVVTFIFLGLINYWLVWLVLIVGLAILLFLIFLKAYDLHHHKQYFLPMFLVAGAVLFLFFPNLKILPLPIEVGPSFNTSLTVAKQTLTGSALWFGSGPGTYLFDYAKFRPVEVNQTNFWNTRFDRGFSEILTMLPTKGLLSSLALFLFSLVIGVAAIKKFRKRGEEPWSTFIIFPAWLALIFAFFIYPSNFTLTFLFFLLSSLLYSQTNEKTQTLSLIKSPRLKILTSIGFTILAVVFVTVSWLAVERFSAEYAYAQAIKLDRAGGDLKEVAKLIDRAATTNRFNDAYYRNLAEVLFLETKAEITNLSAKQPTGEENQYLQALISASVNTAKKATDLEPRNVTNWLELGSIYRTLASLAPGAENFALEAGQKAIALEPQNPNNYLELGKTYLALAIALEPMTVSEDPTKKQTAEQKKQEYFTAAEATINKALSLKADYAPAHYQLALVFERWGKLDEAIGKMESINKYNPQDVSVAFELGILYLRRLGAGDLARAEIAFKQAITLLPAYSNAHWYLAFVYEQQNNLPAAIYEVEAVAKLNPDNEMVKTRLERLKAGQITAPAETAPLE
ncbi:MAG: tetratricopeptide repeat protein [Candidatus Uhrbacteria bacterium]